MSLTYEVKKRYRKLTLSAITYNDKYSLTYELHDYGALAYWLKKYGKVNDDPLWKLIDEIYALDDSYGKKLIEEGKNGKFKRRNFILWYLGKLQEIDATTEVESKKYRLGEFGKLAFEVAKKTSNWTESLESVIVAYLVAEKMRNLEHFLEDAKKKPIRVSCTNVPRETSSPEEFEISWKDLGTSFKNTCFLHSEPSHIPDLRSVNNPLVLSGIFLNEISSIITAIRGKILARIAEVGKTSDFFIVSDRGFSEIKRALEHMDVLQSGRGTWYTCIPDHLLSTFAIYGLSRENKETIPLRRLTEIIREDFRFLIDPDDVIYFLREYVEFETLGVDLSVLRNFLEENFADLKKRLVSLGYSTIRPDGEATIETLRIKPY